MPGMGFPARIICNEIRKEFMAMFYPEDAAWREAVLAEGAKAVEHVLRAEELWRAR